MNTYDTIDESINSQLTNNKLKDINKSIFSSEETVLLRKNFDENLDKSSTESFGENSEENRLESFLYSDTKSEEENKPQECTALVTVKERRIMAAQTMFKKSIKITIKSFLVSLSLSFLNLFL